MKNILFFLSFCLLLFSCEDKIVYNITSHQFRTQGEMEYVDVPVPPDISLIDESDYTTYYVNSLIGNDNNSGLSETLPIKSLNKVAIIARNPKTKILFKSGLTFTGTLTLSNLQSTADKPLIIDKYGGSERPHIKGNGPEAAVYIQDDYVRFRNIKVTCKEGTKGIYITTSNAGAFKDLQITGCRIEEVNWLGSSPLPDSPANLDVEAICPTSRYDHATGGICFDANTSPSTGPSWFENIYITNNEIYKVSRSGIWMTTQWGRRPGLDWGYNNYVDDNNGWYPAINVIVQNNKLSYIGGDGVALIATKNSFIQGNVLTHANYLGRSGFYNAGLWPHSSVNFVMQYNEVSYTHLEHGSGDGEALDVDVGCINTQVQFNYAHHNDGGGVLICNGASSNGEIGNHTGTVIRNNLFYDNYKDQWRGAFLNVGSGVKDALIYNNLIIATGSLSEFKFVLSGDWANIGKSKDFFFINNIFLSLSQVNAHFDISSINNCVFTNNLAYQIGNELLSLDQNLRTYNPQVVIPSLLSGYENSLKFRITNYNVFTDGLIFNGMLKNDMKGRKTYNISYLGPFVPYIIEAENNNEGIPGKTEPYWIEHGIMFGSNEFILIGPAEGPVTYPININVGGLYNFRYDLACWYNDATLTMYIDNVQVGLVSIPHSDDVHPDHINISSINIDEGNHEVKLIFSRPTCFEKFVIL